MREVVEEKLDGWYRDVKEINGMGKRWEMWRKKTHVMLKVLLLKIKLHEVHNSDSDSVSDIDKVHFIFVIF